LSAEHAVRDRGVQGGGVADCLLPPAIASLSVLVRFFWLGVDVALM
jgi:hypothetical protein